MNKKLGAIYGALLGDACGCPYEFKAPENLPAFEHIDMTPPPGFKRSWKSIPVGTYTDDGAQALILLETLLSGKELLPTLRAKLLAWLGGGYMSVDNVTFDSGMQTKHALMYCDDIADVARQLSEPTHSGNGSLMRSIPVALVAKDLSEAMTLGAKHSLVTHPNVRSQMTCAIYCGIAYEMLQGKEADEVVDEIILKAILLRPNATEEIQLIAESEQKEPTGTGYVVDALWSALYALRKGETFKDVIKYAIELGNDTDTTACIAGGLAGIKFGYEGLPQDWLDLLRGKYLIEPIVNQLK